MGGDKEIKVNGGDKEIKVNGKGQGDQGEWEGTRRSR